MLRLMEKCVVGLIVQDHGKLNIVDVSNTDLLRGSGLIEFRGSRASVSIGTPNEWGRPHIICERNSRVVIGRNCTLASLFVYAGPGASIVIGKGTGFSGGTALTSHEANISIGERCLFGSETHVMSSDMHAIVARRSGERINLGADVTIHDRVWIGFRAVVLKGVTISEGAIIGTGSVVTKQVPAHCVAAGNPARVIRKDVSWTEALH
ncbi:acyltransferase [Lichenicoccus roseus]|uniref:Acyltransferase n=2 Tax=Lichenicoccus roseus TaxID=2683649 RepID=A0A5R9IYK5_9PROT|nr:acyltransferase [Lichenicoccus roseus]